LKPKILIFIDWFLPGYKAGGPIKSVSNIINSLSDEFDFFIITSDRDLGDTAAYENEKLNQWVKKDNYSIIYLSHNKREKWISNHLISVNYNKYYFNSLFSKNFTIKPLLVLNKLGNKNIIIAPRGMLGKGALAIKSFKKKKFLRIANLFGWYKNVTWHATNISEKQDVINNFWGKSNIKIASNISINHVSEKIITKNEDELKIVSFSRISPKKNLLYALKLLKDLNQVSLDIYGSMEDENYWKVCTGYIKSHNLNTQYTGEILPVNVNTVLADYHFLLFPTQHENYGHVIVEALTAGCGLIISDNTPWKNLEEKKIGWNINLSNKETFLNTLKYCTRMKQEEYNTIRNNCYKFVENEINSNKEIEDTKKLFS
jgi:glycosyltransferase involved in cell wall biosynthesis